MDKEEMRQKFIREHNGLDIGEINFRNPSLNPRPKKVPADRCPDCEMHLNSPYHLKYPCKPI